MKEVGKREAAVWKRRKKGKTQRRSDLLGSIVIPHLPERVKAKTAMVVVPRSIDAKKESAIDWACYASG